MGPASDDVGWLNAGADIVVHGHATNGCGNAMAQGRICVAGDIGARGMTMTKHNPRFAAPQLWVLGGTGDSFAEFMAGGIAVVCGHEPLHADNVLGHRPCVGMVGGKIFFRGPCKGYSEEDARIEEVAGDEWKWLTVEHEGFSAIHRPQRTFRHPHGRPQSLESPRGEKSRRERRQGHPQDAGLPPCSSGTRNSGKGGLIGDLTDLDRSPIPLITNGILRRYVPVWENLKFLPPCQANCPTGIPVQKRWEMIRKGLVDESVDIALAYTPFPVTVCGYLCPNVCMQNCTRQIVGLKPVDITVLGKASLKAKPPEPAETTGYKVAIVGAGPAGLSIAWQLYLKGHQPVVFDRGEELGERSRVPSPVCASPTRSSVMRSTGVKGLIPTIHLKQDPQQQGLRKAPRRVRLRRHRHRGPESAMLPIPGNRAGPAGP